MTKTPVRIRSLAVVAIGLTMAWHTVGRTVQAGVLARLIPDDVGLFLELDGLSGTVEQIVDSPLYRRALDVPPLSYLTTAADIDRLRKIVTLMSQTMRVEPEVVWRQVFGDQVAFGVWPGGSGAPDSQAGLLLVEAADPRLLTQLIAAVAHAHRQGETGTQVKLLKHAGAKYWSRMGQRDGRETTVFLAAVGRVGAVTANESLMRRVLELAAGGEAPAGSLAASAGYRHSQTQLSDEAPWRVYLNPRPWDAQMPAAPLPLLGDVPASALFARQALSEVWRTTEYWVAAIRMEPPLRIESRWQFDRARLPEPLSRVLASLEGPADMLDRVPVEATMAVGGFFDFRKFASALGPGAAADAEKARSWIREAFLGWDLIAPILTNLQPQVALYLEPCAEAMPGHPLDWAVRLDLPPSTAETADEEPLGKRLDQTIEAVLRLASQTVPRSPNSSPRSLQTETREGVELKSLTFDDLGGSPWTISYAVTGEALVAGSSCEAVLRCAQLQPDRSLATSPLFARLADPRLPHPSHYLFLDCQRLRELVDQRHGDVLRMLMARRSIDDPAAEMLVEQLADLLRSLDRVLISARFDASGVSLSMGADLPEADAEPARGGQAAPPSDAAPSQPTPNASGVTSP